MQWSEMQWGQKSRESNCIKSVLERVKNFSLPEIHRYSMSWLNFYVLTVNSLVDIYHCFLV